MLGKTSRTIGALAAMGLVVAGIVATSGSPSRAAEITTAKPAVVTGTLTLNLFSDRTGVVTLAFGGDGDGSETISQKIISGPSCPRLGLGLLTGGTGTFDRTTTLLDFTPIINGVENALGGTVQLPDNFMGVNSGSSCGGPAGQIGQGEQLRIKLGSYFPATV